MRILKFGGTSVADDCRILEVGRIVQQARAEERVIVVVSALAGITDQLIELTEAVSGGRPAWRGLLGEIRHRHLACLDQVTGDFSDSVAKNQLVKRIDEIEILCSGIELIGQCGTEVQERLLAAGERLSAPIVAAALRSMDLESHAVDAADLIRVVSSGEETVVDLDATTDAIRGWLGSFDPSVIPVVTGFVAGDAAGRTRTLGRGGSDLSASVLGAAVGATRVEIWTDVNGVLTGPPQHIPDVHTIARLSYEEAAEMSFFGASVLHRDTLAPIAEKGIPLWVRNTMAPQAEGTIVSAFGANNSGATAIAAVGEVSVLTIQGNGRFHSPKASGTLGKLVAALQPEALITSQASSDQALTIIVPACRSQRADELARSELGEDQNGFVYRQKNGTCVVAVVGHDLQSQPRVTARVLDTLDQHGLQLLAAASSRHSFTFALDAEVLDQALDALHKALLPQSPIPKETPDVREKKGRHPRRYRQRRPTIRSSVA